MRVSSVFLSVAMLAATGAAIAHHSPAMFDHGRKLVLKGAVRSFQWSNPHSYIQLLVKDDKAGDVEWSLEMGAAMYLYSNGWRPSTLKAGDVITVTIAPLRNGSHGGLVLDATTVDGRKLGKPKP